MKKSGVKWGELIAGVLLTALGAATFADPDGMLAGAVAVYGAIAVIMGTEDINRGYNSICAHCAVYGPWADAVAYFRNTERYVRHYAYGKPECWHMGADGAAAGVVFGALHIRAYAPRLCTAYGQPVLLLVFAGAGHYRHSSQLYDAV